MEDKELKELTTALKKDYKTKIPVKEWLRLNKLELWILKRLK